MDNDFLAQRNNRQKSPKSGFSRVLRKTGLFFSLVVAVLVIVTWVGGVVFSSPINNDEGWYRKDSHKGFFGTLRDLILSDEKRLEGVKADRINLLFLGMGGSGHDGAFLTDTIILASIKPSTNQISLISIPRDLSVPIPGYGWRKINHANAFGEMKDPGHGADLAIRIIEQMTGQPIHYYVRMDFSGFEKLIDHVSGVDINVDNSFVDSAYPTNDHRYQTVKFDEGAQHMDGETALMFARSRHGTNGEGSDFARSRRQQKVIVAFKNKVLSLSTLLNPAKLNNLRKTLSENIDTNIDVGTGLQLVRIADDLDTENIISFGLSDAVGGLLANGSGANLYMLLPRDRTFRQIQRVIDGIFDGGNLTGKTSLSDQIVESDGEVKAVVLSEGNAFIEIQNGTWVVGLAAKAKAELENQGFQITKVDNADDRPYSTSAVFDLSNGKHVDSVKQISEALNMPIASTIDEILQNSTLPADTSMLSANLPTQVDKNTDILIILGADYTETE